MAETQPPPCVRCGGEVRWDFVLQYYRCQECELEPGRLVEYHGMLVCTACDQPDEDCKCNPARGGGLDAAQH